MILVIVSALFAPSIRVLIWSAARFLIYSSVGTVISTILLLSGVNAAPLTLTPWIALSAFAPCASVAYAVVFV